MGFRYCEDKFEGFVDIVISVSEPSERNIVTIETMRIMQDYSSRNIPGVPRLLSFYVAPHVTIYHGWDRL